MLFSATPGGATSWSQRLQFDSPRTSTRPRWTLDTRSEDCIALARFTPARAGGSPTPAQAACGVRLSRSKSNVVRDVCLGTMSLPSRSLPRASIGWVPRSGGIRLSPSSTSSFAGVGYYERRSGFEGSFSAGHGTNGELVHFVGMATSPEFVGRTSWRALWHSGRLEEISGTMSWNGESIAAFAGVSPSTELRTFEWSSAKAQGALRFDWRPSASSAAPRISSRWNWGNSSFVRGSIELAREASDGDRPGEKLVDVLVQSRATSPNEFEVRTQWRSESPESRWQITLLGEHFPGAAHRSGGAATSFGWAVEWRDEVTEIERASGHVRWFRGPQETSFTLAYEMRGGGSDLWTFRSATSGPIRFSIDGVRERVDGKPGRAGIQVVLTREFRSPP